jgi:hypothetical protein
VETIAVLPSVSHVDPKSTKQESAEPRSVTVQIEDGIHEHESPVPGSQVEEDTNKKSLLEQAVQYNSHSDYKPDADISDDESELSMLVLMRYMGCTSRAYGERKHRKESLASESDDDTTLSEWTYENSIRSNTTTDTFEEEGVEMTINEYLPSSTMLTRCESIDESAIMDKTMKSKGNTRSFVNSKSGACDSDIYYEGTVDTEGSIADDNPLDVKAANEHTDPLSTPKPHVLFSQLSYLWKIVPTKHLFPL